MLFFKTPVVKPEGLTKCSHGGILDASSLIPATGGINKDSGFLVFSPHAYLHTQAASLAVEHTEYYFNQIRARIGDDKYNEFMELIVDNQTLSQSSDNYTCVALSLETSLNLFIALCLLSIMINYE